MPIPPQPPAITTTHHEPRERLVAPVVVGGDDATVDEPIARIERGGEVTTREQMEREMLLGDTPKPERMSRGARIATTGVLAAGGTVAALTGAAHVPGVLEAVNEASPRTVAFLTTAMDGEARDQYVKMVEQNRERGPAVKAYADKMGQKFAENVRAEEAARAQQMATDGASEVTPTPRRR